MRPRSRVGRTRRLTLMHAGVALLVAALLSSCNSARPGGDSEGGGSSTVRIGVGGQPLLVYLPTTLAQQLGYYEDEGVKVKLEDLQAGSKALEAMLGGSTDVTSGYYDHTIQMAAKDQPVVAFVNMLRYPALVLAVSPKTDKKIDSIEDLDGANVGVTSPGSSTDFALKHLLTQAGMEPDAAAAQAIGADATAVAAMEQGQVDAAVMIEPAYSQLEKRAGEVKVLSDTRTVEGVEEAYGTETYPAAVLYAQEAWLEKNDKTAGKLARAIKRTLEWIDSHSAEEIAAKMPPQFVGEDKDVYIAALEKVKPSYNPSGALDKAGTEAVREVLGQSQPEVKSADVDVTKTFTNEYVEK